MLPPTVDAAFHTLIDAIAGPEPLPAGGAAGVATIAMGIALGAKVLRISQPTEPAIAAIGEQLEQALQQVLPEFAADCAAFAELLAALGRPRDDGERTGLVAAAWLRATALPTAVARHARHAEALLASCTEAVKPGLRGDLSAAVELVRCGRRIAESNARENAQRLDPASAAKLLAQLDRAIDG